jgi:hypothetical protein
MTILEILQEDTIQMDPVISPDKTPNFGNFWTEIDSCEIQTKFIRPGVVVYKSQIINFPYSEKIMKCHNSYIINNFSGKNQHK